ncbi:hypothetical protein ABPG74_007925 [Tetrahymena malaccensis]
MYSINIYTEIQNNYQAGIDQNQETFIYNQGQSDSDLQNEQSNQVEGLIEPVHIIQDIIYNTDEEQERYVTKFNEQLEDRQAKFQCSKYDFLEKLAIQKYRIILEELKAYIQLDFIIESGEGILFKAKIKQTNENVVIKFIRQDQKDFEQQIKILKELKQFKYFIQLKDHKNIDDIDIYALVFEECECTIDKKIIDINDFDFTQIILSSIQGLMILRLKGILHLDIKPSNLLVKNNLCIYTDFNNSQYKKYGEAVEVKSYTLNYSPQEQIQNNTDKVNHLSDVFSLGKTFEYLLNQQKNIQNVTFKDKLNYIIQRMIQTVNEVRINCFNVFHQFSKEVARQFNQDNRVQDINNQIKDYKNEIQQLLAQLKNDDDDYFQYLQQELQKIETFFLEV